MDWEQVRTEQKSDRQNRVCRLIYKHRTNSSNSAVRQTARLLMWAKPLNRDVGKGGDRTPVGPQERDSNGSAPRPCACQGVPHPNPIPQHSGLTRTTEQPRSAARAEEGREPWRTVRSFSKRPACTAPQPPPSSTPLPGSTQEKGRPTNEPTRAQRSGSFDPNSRELEGARTPVGL